MFINLADITDPNDPQGRTFCQVNAEKRHAIPLGTLVEIDTGERLRVMMHTRDCDQTPLYTLGITISDDEDDIGRKFCEMKWEHGYPEESLKVVAQRFDKTYCSQCGKEFGPGDHGFSHCENHKHLTVRD